MVQSCRGRTNCPREKQHVDVLKTTDQQLVDSKWVFKILRRRRNHQEIQGKIVRSRLPAEARNGLQGNVFACGQVRLVASLTGNSDPKGSRTNIVSCQDRLPIW